MSRIWLIFLGMLLCGCAEEPLFSDTVEGNLNNPLSIERIASGNFAAVTNLNVNLSDQAGSLSLIDLSDNSFVEGSEISIPNFVSKLLVDEGSRQIYIADRANDGVLVYEYDDSNPPQIQSVDVEGNSSLSNLIETDEEPSDIVVANSDELGDVLLVSSSLGGSINFIRRSDWRVFDLDSGSDLRGLPLESAETIAFEDTVAGRGATRMVPKPNSNLVFVTSVSNNLVYVVDIDQPEVETSISLSGIASTVGIRDLLITTNELAYLLHYGDSTIYVLDISNVRDNGIAFEISEPIIVDIIRTSDNPIRIASSEDESTIFVVSQTDGSIDVIDANTRKITQNINLEGQSFPSSISIFEDLQKILIPNFLQNSISVLDFNTFQILGTIE